MRCVRARAPRCAAATAAAANGHRKTVLRCSVARARARAFRAVNAVICSRRLFALMRWHFILYQIKLGNMRFCAFEQHNAPRSVAAWRHGDRLAVRRGFVRFAEIARRCVTAPHRRTRRAGRRCCRLVGRRVIEMCCRCDIRAAADASGVLACVRACSGRAVFVLGM